MNGWLARIGIVVSLICLMGTAAGDVELRVNNPYRWPVEVEVKCDWQPRERAFQFSRRFILAPRRVTVLTVPAGMSSCQIWPHVRF